MKLLTGLTKHIKMKLYMNYLSILFTHFLQPLKGGCNPLVAEGHFHPLPPRTPKLLQSNTMASGPFLCMQRIMHYSSYQTEGIQSSRGTWFWHGAYLNSILKPLQKLQTCFPPKERKKMEELCKVTRILFIYFLTSKVDRRRMI